MELNTKPIFPTDTVLLVDAAFLDFITSDFKKNFERILHRELNIIDLSQLITSIALDGGITAGDNEIAVLLVYDAERPDFKVCTPSSIPEQLNNVAFKNSLGEFSFLSYSTERMASTEEMFLDALYSICESKDVKRLLVVGFNEQYGDKIKDVLKGSKGKLITLFQMDQFSENQGYASAIIAYPIMHALGIKPDELQ